MEIDWQRRPIDQWPGELTKHRRDAPFDAGWGTTVALLERELRMLNARGAVMLVALEASEIRLDGKPKANARPRHPGVILTFESKFGPLRYACDTFRDFADNVRAVALGLEALRKVERYGITKSGEQYKGWSALPPGTAMGARMTREEAWFVLCDLAGAYDDAVASPGSRGDVEDLYRMAAKLNHPDRGGSDDLMSRATEARDRLLEAS